MRYFGRQAWRNICESWRVALQTVLLMGTALLLLGGFLWLAFNLQQILLRWEQQAPVLVYLHEEKAPQTSKRLAQKLKQLRTVRRVRLISAEQAMARLRQGLGPQGKVLKNLDRPLLPSSLEVDLWPWARTPATIQALASMLSQDRGVLDVDYGKEWFTPLWQIARLVRALLLGFGALLLLCTALIAAGTIRLSVLLHQQEIDIMRMVGASEPFVRVPFYLEGALEGLLAALGALLLLYLAYLVLLARAGAAFLHYTSVPLRFLPWNTTLLFVVAGALAGLLGARLALQRFLQRIAS